MAPYPIPQGNGNGQHKYDGGIAYRCFRPADIKLFDRAGNEEFHDRDRRRQRGKKQEDIKEYGPDRSQGHLCKNLRKGNKNQYRTRCRSNPKRKERGKDHEPRQKSHHGICGRCNQHRSGQVLLLGQVGAVGNHPAEPDTEGEERLPQGGDNRIAINFRKIGGKIPFNSVKCARKAYRT